MIGKLSWLMSKGVLFQMDAEDAHRMTVHLIQSLDRAGGTPLRWLSRAPQPSAERAAECLGMRFLNRVGLAAGFDKNAELIAALPAFGFGFAEVGTVTPRPQPGNPRPRLFRDPPRLRLFNCMGFNNDGAMVVSERLRRARERLPSDFRVGVNVGKNKDTPLEQAARDYAAAVEPFEGAADYVVVNVSSPNTPGLRSLQTVDSLRPILSSVLDVTARWKKAPPVLLKLAPELDAVELGAIVEAGEEVGIAGWVLTNTLAGTREQRGGGALKGGWSGAVLSEISRDRLQTMRAKSRLPVVSVGGIMDGEEAQRRIEAGASLIQLYTGWIYGGPTFPGRIVRALDTAH